MSEATVCQICGKTKSANEGQIADVIRPSLLESMRKRYPEWDGRGFVCFEDIGDCRRDYVKEVLQEELGELTALDQEVVESLREHEIITSNIEKQFERKLTFGEHLSDHIAEFGGSWKFLISFGTVIVVWISANVVLLVTKAFDPYPFILLNLFLSMLAAIQAPVIMMSQNRQDKKDRLRSELDFEVNRRAELEIQGLARKLNMLGDKVGDVEDLLRNKLSV